MICPAELERPTLDAIPYINFIFHDQQIDGIKLVIPHPFSHDAWDFDDKCFDKALFASAKAVGEEQVAALAAMTDDTFQSLVGGFRASVNDCQIRHRADLVLSSSFSHDEHPGAAPEQIQAFLLHGARHTFEVHWGLVADLYNSSSPSQQLAICNFFENFLNRQLPELMKTKGPGPVPQSLLPVMPLRRVDDEILVQCQTRHDWIREDILASRFSVEGKRMSSSGEYHLLAFGSSLEEAIAQATRVAQNLDKHSDLYSIQISTNEQVISSTRLISAGSKRSLPGKHRLPIRLSWGDSAVKDIPTQMFRSAAIRVEKHFGVRWSLVAKLEDELGL